MARLIEFFTRTGELVLDPFAGVGGTLLGAAIARGPAAGDRHRARPALGGRLRDGRRGPARRARRRGTGPRRPRHRPTPAARAASTRRAASCASATRSRSCRRSPTGSVDFVATDPPYNVQLPLTMAGGRLAETHANRRTDYAMVTDSPADLANAPDYPTFLDRMGTRLRRARAGPAPGRLRGRHRPRRLPGRALPVHRRPTSRPGPRPPGSSPRATSSGTRPGRGCGRTATRGRSSRTSSTSTSSCCGEEPVRASAGALPRFEVGGEDVVVDVGLAHRPGLGGDRQRGGRRVVRGRLPRRRPPRVILWIQPRPPSGQPTSQ